MVSPVAAATASSSWCWVIVPPCAGRVNKKSDHPNWVIASKNQPARGAASAAIRVA
jgi:hypothetical protein